MSNNNNEENNSGGTRQSRANNTNNVNEKNGMPVLETESNNNNNRGKKRARSPVNVAMTETTDDFTDSDSVTLSEGIVVNNQIENDNNHNNNENNSNTKTNDGNTNDNNNDEDDEDGPKPAKRRKLNSNANRKIKEEAKSSLYGPNGTLVINETNNSQYNAVIAPPRQAIAKIPTLIGPVGITIEENNLLREKERQEKAEREAKGIKEETLAAASASAGTETAEAINNDAVTTENSQMSEYVSPPPTHPSTSQEYAGYVSQSANYGNYNSSYASYDNGYGYSNGSYDPTQSQSQIQGANGDYSQWGNDLSQTQNSQQLAMNENGYGYYGSQDNSGYYGDYSGTYGSGSYGMYGTGTGGTATGNNYRNTSGSRGRGSSGSVITGTSVPVDKRGSTLHGIRNDGRTIVNKDDYPEVPPDGVTCDVCGKNATTRKALLNHRRRHFLIRVQCQHCQKTFSDKQGMQRHISKGRCRALQETSQEYRIERQKQLVLSQQEQQKYRALRRQKGQYP